MEYPKDELFERLAFLEHNRWSDWQRYLHSKLKKVETRLNGTEYYLLSGDLYKHWERQIDTDYKDLSEKEKDSDREQVMRYWKLIKTLFN